MIRFLPILGLALILGGCATGPRCGEDDSYRQAQSIEPIHGIDGLQLPESPSALRVPPLTEAAKVAAETPVGQGKRAACLSWPPEMTAAAAAK